MSKSRAAAAEVAASRLAHDLRRSVSGFVRAVRRDAGTPKSAQTEALELLDRLGPMNVAALAQRRGVTHQAMRLVVTPLIAAGSVLQVTDPHDRRSKQLSISPSGKNLLLQERAARASTIEDVIASRLSPVEQDVLRAAIPLLDRLASPPTA